MRINEILYENQNTVLKNLYLCEGVYYSKSILTEQIIYEGFLDSAKQYLGTQYTKTVNDIKGAITDVKAAAILIKDIVSDQTMLDNTVAQLGKQCRNVQKTVVALITEIKTKIPAISPIVDKLWNMLQPSINSFMQTTGWKGFLAKLGLYGFLSYLKDVLLKAANIGQSALSTITDEIVDKVKQFAGIITNVTMPGFMGFFDHMATVKKYFLDVLTYVKGKLSFGSNIGKTANTQPAAAPGQPVLAK